ncbi:MAG: hypothetical protein ACU0BS_10190, partial [Hasllibacter sp.]
MIFAEAMGTYRAMLANLGAFLDPDTLAVPEAGFGADDLPGGVRYPHFPPGEAEAGRAAFLSPEAVPRITDPDDPGVAILGLIDDAIPLGHPALRANGRSRVASAWLMGARAERAPPRPRPGGARTRGGPMGGGGRGEAGAAP